MKKIQDKEYKICSNCVMDTSAPLITFDKNGKCEYCNNFYNNILPNWKTDKSGMNSLMKIVNKIREVN